MENNKKKRHLTKEHRNNIRKALLGRKITWAHKISKANKGKSKNTKLPEDERIKRRNESIKKYNNSEKSREAQRRYYNDNKEKCNKISNKYQKDSEYQKNNPVSSIRRRAYTQAIKIKIPKNKLCEVCNKNLAVERHHEDYNKPKDIIFICKKCHGLTRRNDNLNKQEGKKYGI